MTRWSRDKNGIVLIKEPPAKSLKAVCEEVLLLRCDKKLSLSTRLLQIGISFSLNDAIINIQDYLW